MVRKLFLFDDSDYLISSLLSAKYNKLRLNGAFRRANGYQLFSQVIN